MLKMFFRILVIAAIILLGIYAKNFYQKAKSVSLDVIDDKIYVETITPKILSMPLTYKTVASLTAKYDINLTSALDGQLSEVVAKSGSKVTKGDALLKLLPKANIIAPISGTIGKWQVKPGEHIKVGTSLVRIVDKNELQADYYIPEKYSKYLKKGQKVIVEIRGYNKIKFEALVNFISPFADPKRHSILVQITIPNENKKLLPGLFSKVTHILKDNPQAIVISESCLIQSLTGYEVFIVKDKKAVKTKVKLGSRSDGRCEIVSGITANDKVILTIPPGLTDGKEVISKSFTGSW